MTMHLTTQVYAYIKQIWFVTYEVVVFNSVCYYCNSGGLKLINKGKLQTSILHNLFSVYNARNELWMREKHTQMQLASDFVSFFFASCKV